MTAYLLTWNPKNWSEERFSQLYADYKLDKVLRWSCGSTKKIVVGDGFYLLKQGKGATGVIGSGTVMSSPYSAAHYESDKAAVGKMALYVNVKFEYLSDPSAAIPIRRDELNSPELACSIWSAQGSGKTIPDTIEVKLAELWHSRVELKAFTYPEEVDSVIEGAKTTVTVNAYERNPEARKRCLDQWGYHCAVCSFHFELCYGPIGKQYIHVHHLKPIASIGEEYEIDPVYDLRPVCPNCHAMLHRENPPLSIEELKSLIARYNNNLKHTQNQTKNPI